MWSQWECENSLGWKIPESSRSLDKRNIKGERRFRWRSNWSVLLWARDQSIWIMFDLYLKENYHHHNYTHILYSILKITNYFVKPQKKRFIYFFTKNIIWKSKNIALCMAGASPKETKTRQHHPGKLQTNRVYGCIFIISQTRASTEALERTQDYSASKKMNVATKECKCF